MKKFQTKALAGFAVSVSAVALLAGAPAYAQDADDCEGEVVDGECVEQVDGIVVDDPETVSEESEGRIVVTGSRLRRDSYNSISPLQILDTEASQEVGLFDASQILQRSESASGTQIDATFQGFVLDNGPGSQTLNLRGLGADRTLLLINGRRLAPAGAEGAPTNPSLNLLPGSLIERYDLLLDGASSVYGSDAVAGVGNIILRTDFDGPELFVRGEINPQGAGEDYTVTGAWGTTFERGFIGIGAEYDYRDEIRLRDREFFAGCSTNYEVTQDGEIRTLGIAADARFRQQTNGAVGLVPDDCPQFVGTGALIISNTFAGAVFRQPDGPGSNFGLPNFGDTADVFGNVIDRNNDGIRDVDFRFNNLDGLNPDQTFLSEQKLYNVMAYGEYDLGGDLGITPFFEANYSRAEISSQNSGISQLTPAVPGDNPFNICNPNQPNGFDCALLDDAFSGLPAGTSAFNNGNRAPGTSRQTRPFFSIRGDRDNFEVTQEQYRGVLGIRGDLPFIGDTWTFEMSGVYSRSEGRSSRIGVRADRLAFALGNDPTAAGFDYRVVGTTLPGGPCDAAGLANADQAQPDLTQGCVPVNVFADSIFNVPFGAFATDAERNYLLDSRDFDTSYEQILASAFVQGDLIELPAGPLGIVLGVEFRDDTINSQPDAVASQGLLAGFFSDEGAAGSKNIYEAFGEISIPVFDSDTFGELNVDAAGRVTDEEFYGTNYTYSLKAGWRPIPEVLLRATYGTSFRAPNLRENFLRGQTGFLFLNDPCAIPDVAFQALAGNGRDAGYQPDLDTRDANIIQNCNREGRDPTRVGINANGTNVDQSQSVEIRSGGSLDIQPETSTSFTTGFAVAESYGDFDVSFSMSYFDIQLRDTIVEPSSQFIVNDCFLREDGQRSPFCDRIVFDTDAANTRLLISDINNGFINLNQEAVRGIDFNASIGQDINTFGTPVRLGLAVTANHLIERSSTFVDDLGEVSFDDDAGEISLPAWTGRSTFTADVDDLRLTYQVRYTGAVEQDALGIDAFSDAFGNGPDGQPTGFNGDTCLGGGSVNNDAVAGTGVFCRDVGFAEEQFLHTASLRYRHERFTLIVGVDNIFDTPPPLADGNEVTVIANTIIGAGYDYDGREFFASLNIRF